MSYMNKCFIMGHLGRDPEMKYTGAGTAIADFSVATSETWKDKQTGEKREKTEWHNVVFFGRQAEVAGEYLKKGALVMVEGMVTYDKWEDKDGNKRTSTKIKGHHFTMFSKQSQGTPEHHKAPSEPSLGDGFQKPAPKPPPVEMQQEILEDDIPF